MSSELSSHELDVIHRGLMTLYAKILAERPDPADETIDLILRIGGKLRDATRCSVSR